MCKRAALAALLVLACAGASLALNPQPEPPMPYLDARGALDPALVKQVALKYVIAPVAALKASARQARPARVTSTTAKAPSSNTGGLMRVQPSLQAVRGHPYREGNGVVLDVVHPRNTSVTAGMTLHQAVLDFRVSEGIAANNPQTSVLLRMPAPGATGPMLSASFAYMDPGTHTYMLTIGTSADKQCLAVKVGNQKLAPDALIANAETHEVRVLFTYTTPDTPMHFLTVNVMFEMPQSPTVGIATFHHLQLAQLD